jgi:anthranilate phosphoribosyltransferase
MSTPDDLGLMQVAAQDIAGGNSVEESAKIFLNVLKNEATVQQQEVVIANAALALWCAQPETGLESAVMLARETLESGKAFQTFKQFINPS